MQLTRVAEGLSLGVPPLAGLRVIPSIPKTLIVELEKANMAEEANFKCLRCGHEFKMPYDPKGPMVERACPKCLSNSVRRMKEEQKK